MRRVILTLGAGLLAAAAAAGPAVAATLGIPTRPGPVISGVGTAFHDRLLGFDLLGLAVADHVEGHDLAGLEQRDLTREVGVALDPLAVHGDDHVTAGVDLLALKADRTVAALQPGFVGGAARNHLGDDRPGVDVEVEALG